MPPLHDFMCLSGHVTEQFVPHGTDAIACSRCAEMAGKVFLRFPHAMIAPDVHYESPVDGRVINSKHARLEDLARHNCVEYDPAMKDDYLRRIDSEEAKLDAKVEHIVESEIQAMPTRKRELLEQELRSGAGLEFNRA